MQAERERAAREFFGYEAQMGEDGKLEEEINEILTAFLDYRENPSIDNLERLLNELNDARAVGIGEWVYNGMPLEQIESKADMKAQRTIDIINKIPPGVECKVKAYDELRCADEQKKT